MCLGTGCAQETHLPGGLSLQSKQNATTPPLCPLHMVSWGHLGDNGPVRAGETQTLFRAAVPKPRGWQSGVSQRGV